MTGGHNLAARHVIHCVGPVWHGGDSNEDELLAGCYRSALAIAKEHGVESVAFPAISTGAYGFPPDRAARIAVETVEAHADPSIRLVRFVCFDNETADVYRQVMADLSE